MRSIMLASVALVLSAPAYGSGVAVQNSRLDMNDAERSQYQRLETCVAPVATALAIGRDLSDRERASLVECRGIFDALKAALRYRLSEADAFFLLPSFDDFRQGQTTLVRRRLAEAPAAQSPAAAAPASIVPPEFNSVERLQYRRLEACTREHAAMLAPGQPRPLQLSSAYPACYVHYVNLQRSLQGRLAAAELARLLLSFEEYFDIQRRVVETSGSAPASQPQ